jgi:hypothetical protein
MFCLISHCHDYRCVFHICGLVGNFDDYQRDVTDYDFPVVQAKAALDACIEHASEIPNFSYPPPDGGDEQNLEAYTSRMYGPPGTDTWGEFHEFFNFTKWLEKKKKRHVAFSLIEVTRDGTMYPTRSTRYEGEVPTEIFFVALNVRLVSFNFVQRESLITHPNNQEARSLRPVWIIGRGRDQVPLHRHGSYTGRDGHPRGPRRACGCGPFP